MSTIAPSSAARWAAENPMPVPAAAVTTTVLPCNRFLGLGYVGAIMQSPHPRVETSGPARAAVERRVLRHARDERPDRPMHTSRQERALEKNEHPLPMKHPSRRAPGPPCERSGRPPQPQRVWRG